MNNKDKKEIFENMPIRKALFIMAVPTIISQLITLIYNIADTYFIGQTNNPYMVAACSLSATVYLMVICISNLFGVGGGNLVVQLIGKKDNEEASKVASYSLLFAGIFAILFSLLCFIFIKPLLYTLGASNNTYSYARQYLLLVVVIGTLPTVLSNTMSSLLRNVGYAKEAAFGLGMGGILNMILDPIFMFILFPDGYQVLGAACATLLSNIIAFLYYVFMYKKVEDKTVLHLPRHYEKITYTSLKAIYSIGLPAALSLLFYDLCNIMINMLSAGHGDIELAAIGIILKIERLPLNIGIGICLGMVPLVAYNYAAKNKERMKAFFLEARVIGMIISIICVILYHVFAFDIMKVFIDDSETVRLGTIFLQARCFATPFMFLSFNMVHFMQSVKRGGISFWLAFIRQICLNIPLLFILNHYFGMLGIIWTQVIADILNVIASYIIYYANIHKIYAECSDIIQEKEIEIC